VKDLSAACPRDVRLRSFNPFWMTRRGREFMDAALQPDRKLVRRPVRDEGKISELLT